MQRPPWQENLTARVSPSTFQFWWLPRRDRTRPGSVRNPGLSSPSRGPHPEAGKWRGLVNGRESVKRPERHLPGDVVGRQRGLPSVRQEVGARRDPRDLRERGLTRGNSRWTKLHARLLPVSRVYYCGVDYDCYGGEGNAPYYTVPGVTCAGGVHSGGRRAPYPAPLCSAE